MSTKEFTKIHELLERLRKETENCIARVEELEEEFEQVVADFDCGMRSKGDNK